eukprot:15372319-Alexandrium_andersonii.AAC.1
MLEAVFRMFQQASGMFNRLRAKSDTAVPSVQSAMHSRSVSAAIRFNPQLALPSLQPCFRRSDVELRGPRNGLKTGPRSRPRVQSASLLEQIPDPPTKSGA